MSEASDTRGILRQNLIDAGCEAEVIETCLKLAGEEQWESMLALLSRQKRRLLERVHFRQKQIDCLDFLVYHIHKKQISEEGIRWKQH